MKINYFPHDIETIFIEIFLSMTVGIVYRPPSQTSFLEKMNEHFYKLVTINKETYILHDFNINLHLNNKYIFEECSTIVSNTFPYDVRKYQECCNVFNLKQLISCPARISCSSSTIIDHVLASCADRVSQKGIIDIEISDHQLIFCTRKTLKTKTASHKQISFRSLKNYSAVTYGKFLKKVKFSNYENFINRKEAYSNFIPNLTSVIDEIAPCKTKRVKGNSKEWFDSVVSEGINNRDKLFKKFKKSRLPLGQKNYKKARYEVKKLIAEKKRNFLETKLIENIGKSKELWKTLKALGLPNKVSIATTNALKNDKEVKYNPKSISKVFQTSFTNMAKHCYKSFHLPQTNMILIH